ncbi:intradiol ring-cleavage dioxygenase [Leptolyngbya sp. NIES-3755]|nr:intradiol ring-cleavage dioxygenase [Leptolyngbya sp. NIES-3755]
MDALGALPNKTMSILNRLINRRNTLRFFGSTAFALLVGCLPKRNTVAQSTSNTIAQSSPGCVVRPEQTEGPYFVDERLNRSDIRSDSKSGVVKAGVPLQLKLRVTQVSDRSCTPIQGAIVDIWHCDGTGSYSDVRETAGQNFLRGYQTTDSNGNVEFLTIYPGWYQGRTVHIHFKVRNANQEFTSQLYFDDALTDQVQARSPYSTRGQRTVRNDRDGIYQDGGDQLLLSPTKTNQGYAATFEIGLQAV